MKERFEGTGHVLLVEAIKRQEFVGGNDALAAALAQRGTLHEYAPGERIMTEGGEDDDLFLLLTGSTAVTVKGHRIVERKAGDIIGEMDAIEPSLARSATVIAIGTVVALKISNADFLAVGKEHPSMWLPIARELARRLHVRNARLPEPRGFPRLFIVSSSEGLDVANEIQAALMKDVFCTIWNQGAFFAGNYPLDDLEASVAQSDFAVAVSDADDIVESRGERRPTLRDNVLFEFGMAIGKLGRARSFLIQPRGKGLKLPSDLSGLTLLSYEPGSAGELAARLGPACTAIRKAVRVLGVRQVLV